MILIVDGYNVINAWSELSELAADNLENARIRLENQLRNYCGFRGYKLLLVYDAHMSQRIRPSRRKNDGQVVYTSKNETADNYIERFVRQHDSEDMIVVSSDSLVQVMIFSKALRMSSRELEEDMRAVFAVHRSKTAQQLNFRKTALEDRLAGDVLETLDKWRKHGR